MQRYRPFIEVSVGGRAVSSGFYSRLNRASITDAPGQDGDRVELRLDDAGNEIEIPPEGARIAVVFGFVDGGSWKMGTFVLEKSAIEFGPEGEFVTLSGRSADMRQDIKEPLSEHFDDETIGGIVGQLAGRHGYGAKVSPSLAAIRLPYVARLNQSAVDFLTRLADRNRALFAVKEGQFLFLERGELAPLTIAKDQCESARFSLEPRPRHSRTEAGWFERRTGRTHFEQHATGLEGPVRRLRPIYASQVDAHAAAAAEGDRLGRATGTGSLRLAGVPEAAADMPVLLTGFRPEVEGLWRAGTVTHTYDDTYTTTIELEAPEEGRQG